VRMEGASVASLGIQTDDGNRPFRGFCACDMKHPSISWQFSLRAIFHLTTGAAVISAVGIYFGSRGVASAIGGAAFAILVCCVGNRNAPLQCLLSVAAGGIGGIMMSAHVHAAPLSALIGAAISSAVWITRLYEVLHAKKRGRATSSKIILADVSTARSFCAVGVGAIFVGPIIAIAMFGLGLFFGQIPALDRGYILRMSVVNGALLGAMFATPCLVSAFVVRLFGGPKSDGGKLKERGND